MKTRLAIVAFAATLAPTLAKADGAAEVRMAPSEAGRLGAWLIAGPFHSATFADKKKPTPLD
ncbi:MAG: hypothetical protein ACLQVI_39860, partial [Polyangiaceae bacterium]